MSGTVRMHARNSLTSMSSSLQRLFLVDPLRSNLCRTRGIGSTEWKLLLITTNVNLRFSFGIATEYSP